jgi:hypothetical protein
MLGLNFFSICHVTVPSQITAGTTVGNKIIRTETNIYAD